MKLRPAAVIGDLGPAPVALCVAMPRSRARDMAICALNMWAYMSAYEMPNDDPERLRARVRVDYPMAVDRVLGLGVPPTLRLQRALSVPGRINRFERVLVWCHWLWFMVPHGSVGYVLLRRPERFPSAAARMYAVFDVGAIFYWAIPTAPPWWAARHGRLDPGDGPVVRRMMIEYGEEFWGARWGGLYDVLGGNPLAAMPSLHFATSLMGARLLSEVDPVAGAVGWTYALLLGLALVYLGEHYAVDLVAGAALTESIWAAAPTVRALRSRDLPASPVARAAGRGEPLMPRLVRLRSEGPADKNPSPAVPPVPGVDHQEEMPRVRFTRRSMLASIAFVVTVVAFLYFVLPKLLGLKDTWNRIEAGNEWWLALGVVLEGLSFLGYVALFRAVFIRGRSRIDWRESYEITMAGLAATRLFASAGAGGIALTAWALRRSGMGARIVACRMVAFMALLYGVYMIALVIDGLGLYLGVFPGPAPFAITMVPAIFGAVVIALFLAVSLLPGDFDRFVGRWAQRAERGGRLSRLAARVATIPATAATGVRTALDLVRSRDPHVLGAIAWWGFDIAVLWACFHAFGQAPPQAVIVMAYFVGMLGNTLPLPGGIGGVDGGMIGAFSAFGVPVEVSIVSVLAYRGLAFWLPTLPGAVAYLQLRRTVSRWRTSEAPSYT